jgi:hypothetical protein
VRELASAVAHYIAGVLDRDAMAALVEGFCRETPFAPGDRVKTPRGSLRGEVVAILDDGRVQWRAETGSLLISSAESLLPDP